MVEIFSSAEKINIPFPAEFDPVDAQILNGSVPDRFKEIARRYPEQIAVRSNGMRLTYAELDRRASQVAFAALAIDGPQPRPVPFLLDHDISAVKALLGLLKAGKSYSALDPSLPRERMLRIIADLGAATLVSNQRNLAAAQGLAEAAGGLNVLNLDEIATDAAEAARVQIKPDDLAYIVYTAGSTGEPKGVMRSHLNLLHDFYTQSNSQGLSTHDHIGLVLWFGFEAARSPLYGALLSGGTLCMYDVKNNGVVGLAGWLQSEEITFILTTPSLFRHIFDVDPSPACFSSMRLMTLGGEPVTSRDVKLFQRYFPPDSILVNTIGSSEAGVFGRYPVRTGDVIHDKILTVGWPPPGKRIVIAAEDGSPAAEGEVGEVCVESRYLSPGYWRRPELTAERYKDSPQGEGVRIYGTRDLGRLRPDGNLEYLGRKDNQVKVRGYRVEIEAIEAVLHDHPLVKDVAVIAYTDHNCPEENRLAAYVVTDCHGELPAAEFREFLAKQLPDYMLPAEYIPMEQIPRTAVGKVNRPALPQPDEVRIPERRQIPPRDEVEKALAAIWERTLKIHPVGVTDNYFELGGNSLLAAQLFAAIEKSFGRKLPLAALLEAPTIEQQARILKQEDWVPSWSSLVALRGKGSRPPVFLSAPVGGNVLSYHDLLRYLDADRPVYGLQALGLDGIQQPHRSIQEVAGHYIKEIRALQPNGPYYLAGSSFGGLVSYEIAQQLKDQGEDVALVVMIDTYGPNYPRRKKTGSRLRRKVFKYLRRLDTHWSNLTYANWPGRLHYVQIRGKKLVEKLSNRLRERMNQALHPAPKELRRIRRAHMDASRGRKRYLREPRRFDGRLVLFRAEKQPLGIYHDDTLGWGAVIKDGLEIYEMPGHHTSLIYEPRVHVLAEKLNEILKEI